MSKTIHYSEKYTDDKYEYRHVHLPKDLAKLCPKQRLMSESEWRGIGIQQSQGWCHYLIHEPEPHIILFRRPRTDLPHSSELQKAEDLKQKVKFGAGISHNQPGAQASKAVSASQ